MTQTTDKHELTLARYREWPTLESVVETRKEVNGTVGAMAFAIGDAEVRISYCLDLATELLTRAKLAESRLKRLQLAIDMVGADDVYEAL